MGTASARVSGTAAGFSARVPSQVTHEGRVGRFSLYFCPPTATHATPFEQRRDVARSTGAAPTAAPSHAQAHFGPASARHAISGCRVGRLRVGRVVYLPRRSVGFVDSRAANRRPQGAVPAGQAKARNVLQPRALRGAAASCLSYTYNPSSPVCPNTAIQAAGPAQPSSPCDFDTVDRLPQKMPVSASGHCAARKVGLSATRRPRKIGRAKH